MQSQRLANGTALKTSSREDVSPFLSSASKRVAVSALSRPDFEALVARIDKAFAQVCGENLKESILQPEACRRWLDGERDRYAPLTLLYFCHG